MKRWLRRLLFLLVGLLWLVLMVLPLGAFLLAARGELQAGADPQNHVRLFLVQEEENQGIGIEWVRPSRKAPDCHQSTVSFLLWRGEGENVVFCSCSDPATGEPLPSTFNACSAPD